MINFESICSKWNVKKVMGKKKVHFYIFFVIVIVDDKKGKGRN